jgi:hypothetical protein
VALIKRAKNGKIKGMENENGGIGLPWILFFTACGALLVGYFYGLSISLKYCAIARQRVESAPLPLFT